MDLATARIIDASLNRATEGLRVIEDYARFHRNDAHLARLAKQARHQLAELATVHFPPLQLHTARDTPGDVGTAISTRQEAHRGDLHQVCTASLKRTQQALRSLEEYGKLSSTEFASGCEALRYQLYTLEKALTHTTHACQQLADARLYVLVSGGSDHQTFIKQVRSLVQGGVDVLQLRDKTLDGAELLRRAQTLVAESRSAGVLSIINDRADIAAAAQADGVHLGQEDLTVAAARMVVGDQRLIGVSSHSLPQARQAVLDGADYLGVGPTFPSQTKSFKQFPGVELLRQVSSEIALPAFAIGGISGDNLPEVLAAGFARIAVSNAVTSSADVPSAAQSLKTQLTAAAASCTS